MLSVSVQKKYGDFYLNVSFEAAEETLALLGASGCGKSLALRCIAGLEQPDRGRIVLNGRVLFDSSLRVNLTPQQRRVGYLFQNGALFPNMTVAENIAFGVHLKDRQLRSAAVARQIAAMQLQGLENRRPAQLSGGQQQRVALARMLASEPELLLLDEPFTALDEHLRSQLELDLADMLTAYGRTAIFVSHSRQEVSRLADSVCVINRGRSEPRQSIRDLFDSPASLAACRLSGCQNFSRVRWLDDRHVEALDWGITLTVPGEQTMPSKLATAGDWIGVRAHHLRRTDQPGENTWLLPVERATDNLASAQVILRTSAGSRLRLEMDKHEWQILHEPRELLITIRPQDIMLLKEESEGEPACCKE